MSSVFAGELSSTLSSSSFSKGILWNQQREFFFSALLCNRFGSQRGARLVVSLQKLTTEACGCQVSQLKEDLWMEDDTNTSHMMRQQRIRLVWHCSG
jgi:hypothetical protein